MPKLIKVSDNDYDLLNRLIIAEYNNFHKGNMKEMAGKCFRFYASIKHPELVGARAHVQNQKIMTTNDFESSNLSHNPEEANAPKKILQKRNEIVVYLEREYHLENLLKTNPYEDFSRAHVEQLVKAIIYACGQQRRTVKAWFNHLIRYDLIKETRKNIFEFAPFIEDLEKQKQQQQVQQKSQEQKEKSSEEFEDTISKYIDQ